MTRNLPVTIAAATAGSAAAVFVLVGCIALIQPEDVLAQAPSPEAAATQTYRDAAGHALDAASVERGRRWFRDRANCKYCHGWDGNGSLVEGEPPAPALTKTTLAHADIVTTVACGRIGTTMPTHLADAWTPDYPCYGLTRADVPAGQFPRRPFGTLTLDQINDVANYVEAVYQGKMMTYENCVAFFQRPTEECKRYAPAAGG